MPQFARHLPEKEEYIEEEEQIEKREFITDPPCAVSSPQRETKITPRPDSRDSSRDPTECRLNYGYLNGLHTTVVNTETRMPPFLLQHILCWNTFWQ